MGRSDDAVSTDAVVTIPNLLSALRLLLVPVLVWLILTPGAELPAIGVLIVSGVTDYLDGVVARRTGQVSRLGQILDPLVDRITVVATLGALAWRSILPWWLVAALLARELVLLAVLPLLRRHGLLALPVHYLGKAATFALFWGFPLLLGGATDYWWHPAAGVLGWACVLWGLGLYWYAAVLYLEQAVRLERRSHDRSRTPRLPGVEADH